ncbi:MAG: sensor histidine kinase [Anaerolineaceae bacterium]
MFNSLRSRLWFSNMLLILAVFIILAAGLVLVFTNSPISYRQTTIRLKVIENNLLERISNRSNESQDHISELLIAETKRSQVRLLVVNGEQNIEFDTGRDLYPFLADARFNLTAASGDDSKLFPVRDSQNNRWLYTAAPLNDKTYLVTLIPRPILALNTLIRDDVFVALFRAILISLVIAFGLSLLTARWISKPLQNLVGGVQDLSRGEFRSLPLEGPREIQELAQAYNEMSMRVKDNQHAQRDFIANVSHELKTPLTSIQGFAQSIIDGTTHQPDKLKDAGRIIFNEAQRMNRLVLDLLTLTRLESGISDLKPAPILLNEILLSVVEKFQPQAAGTGQVIDFKPGEEITLTADGDRLAQVFSNLVDNAIKFTPSGRKIQIKSWRDGSSGYVEVQDTGRGIPEGDLNRIFERFYQVEKSRKGGAGHGSGLGLSIAQKIVRAHGGEIKVESGPEKGTKFTVQLPINERIFD